MCAGSTGKVFPRVHRGPGYQQSCKIYLMAVHEDKQGRFALVPAFNGGDGHEKHPAGVHVCETDHPAECAEELRDLIG